MLILYGIPNCDSCRKARKWLDAHAVRYQFHDLRVDGLKKTSLVRWMKFVGWPKLLNTRSTTWRGIPEADKKDLNETRAVELMLKYPTLIKRPVLDTNNAVFVGFSAETVNNLHRIHT